MLYFVKMMIFQYWNWIATFPSVAAIQQDLQTRGHHVIRWFSVRFSDCTGVYPLWIQNPNAGSSVTSLGCGIIEATFDFGTWTVRCARNIANTLIDWTENRIMVFPLKYCRLMPFLQEIVNKKVNISICNCSQTTALKRLIANDKNGDIFSIKKRKNDSYSIF